MNKKEIGLYIHIPFCAHKCDYCDFVSFSNKEDIIDKYINKLLEEIKQENLEQYKIRTIYIGGGTPSFIPSKYITEVLKSINTVSYTHLSSSLMLISTIAAVFSGVDYLKGGKELRK